MGECGNFGDIRTLLILALSRKLISATAASAAYACSLATSQSSSPPPSAAASAAAAAAPSSLLGGTDSREGSALPVPLPPSAAVLAGQFVDGVVAVTFTSTSAAGRCVEALHNRWFDGRQLWAVAVLPPAVQLSSLSHPPMQEGLNASQQQQSARAQPTSSSTATTTTTDAANNEHRFRTQQQEGRQSEQIGAATDPSSAAGAGEVDDVDDFLNSLL